MNQTGLIMFFHDPAANVSCIAVNRQRSFHIQMHVRHTVASGKGLGTCRVGKGCDCFAAFVDTECSVPRYGTLTRDFILCAGRVGDGDSAHSLPGVEVIMQWAVLPCVIKGFVIGVGFLDQQMLLTVGVNDPCIGALQVG